MTFAPMDHQPKRPYRDHREIKNFVIAKVIEPFDPARHIAILRCNNDWREVLVHAKTLRKGRHRICLRKGQELRVRCSVDCLGQLIAADVCKRSLGSKPRLECYQRHPKHRPRYS